MIEPVSPWTEERLRSYLDTTESLTVEFKGCRALLAVDRKDKNERIQEAARDVTAMANEQGGLILYGIQEAGDGPWRRAIAIEDGFKREDKVSRDRFLPTMRDHIHPLLSDLDAFDVRLSTSVPDGPRYALVVQVPQARGWARQTDDLMFYRRNGHGRHLMSVQEIADVASRATIPRLDLSVFVTEAVNRVDSGVSAMTLTARFHITNASQATSSFAAVSLGNALRVQLSFISQDEWQLVTSEVDLKIARFVLASGSSRKWSPITPHSTHFTDVFVMITPNLEIDSRSPRSVGLVRLDHDGGSTVYVLVYYGNVNKVSDRLRLVPYSVDARESYLERVGELPLFQQT